MKSLDLTIVDEYPLVVKFADDLRSGTVDYWMTLNDTGLLGARAATMTWRGKLSWERAEDDDGIILSKPKHPKRKADDDLKESSKDHTTE